MRVVGATGRLQWICDRVGCVLTRNARAIAAIGKHDDVRAMVAYDAWTEKSAQVHMAADVPIAWRSLLKPAFEYPFLELNLDVLLGLVRADNEASMNLVQHFGFTEAHRVKGGAAEGIDLVLFEMRREDCQYVRAA